MIAFSIKYVNKKDNLYLYSSWIPEFNGYETVVCHGSEDYVYIYTNENIELGFSADEFAEKLKESHSYKGGNIRLIACNTGAKKQGFAQKLANKLKIDVIAPTEAVWVNSYGELFVSDSDVLADMWYSGERVVETGKWILFHPKEGRE